MAAPGDSAAWRPQMSKDFEQGKAEVAALCDHFARNREAFRAPGRKEAHVRQDLIDPFFRALGWDVGNAARVAPQYCEVVVEDSLDVEGQRKAPDYTFRVGTLPKFYVEAKKCGINIFADPAPAYQLRRYGWSAKVAVSILTDFEELGVYDCAMRPRPGDKASHARILYYRFEEYPDRWRELWDIFSREAVWTGAFDQYAASKRKRGTSEVDVEFLKEIEGWRDQLARNIALRNAKLSGDELNRAVQLIIDRIVFLRMAEDRGIEPSEQLLTLCGRGDIYEGLMKLCRKADDKYNSGLFHFQKEAGVDEVPDTITPRLAVDDKVLKPILQGLYFAHGSPYEFQVMPVEILGTVYERFLGKVIRLTAGHQAKVEEKPEVRKAGGVYYTPKYIVDYIVRQTVGRQIEGKSPAQLAGKGKRQPLRVLDMACGSGSFLLGAYQCLLDHCLKWYIDNGPKSSPTAVYAARAGDWRLTISEKKRLLTTHIFGVDIDPQAVEVSKLSLLLKVLEGESAETVGDTMRLFHQRALPNLSDNIKCGNSLIGPDYFTGRLFDKIPDAEEYARVNAFDWKREFPEVFSSKTTGGFDCVIGNPPYIRIQTMKETAPLEVEIYKELYKTARQGNYDIYVVFIEQGLKLLNVAGRLGFICPHKFFNSKYGQPLRGIVAEGQHLAHVVHFGDQQVFDGATTYTCLLFLDKLAASECRYVNIEDLPGWRADHARGDIKRDRTATDASNSSTHTVREAAAFYAKRSPERTASWTEAIIPASQITSAPWNFVIGPGARAWQRVQAISTKLGDVAHLFVGLQTSADAIFVVPSDAKIESGLTKPFLLTGELTAYAPALPSARLIFPYEIKGDEAELISASALAKAYPRGWAYLTEHRDELESRERGKWRHDRWYAFGRSQNLTAMDAPKLIIQVTARKPTVLFDEHGLCMTGGGSGPFYGVRPKHLELPIKYLLGILNSTLFGWLIKAQSTNLRGGYIKFSKQYIESAPIPLPAHAGGPASVVDDMEKLVGSMLELRNHLSAAKSTAQRKVIQRQIEATDAEIDQLVYRLYGLTNKEIAIVEGGRA
jgi:hypothetical protein